MMLIKVHARPINPSDKNCAKGTYGKIPGKETLGIGFEGAGEIIQVSKNLDSSLVGKKAAFCFMIGAPGYEGTWREYIHVSKENVVIYPDHAEYNQMAWSFVNPQTVCYFWYLIEKNNHKAVIQDAACSSLGKMFIKLCQKENLPIINIVRRDEQVKELLELGAEYVLNSESEDFTSELEKLIEKLQPKAYFDWIGGKLSTMVFSKLPRYSTLYIFGDLSKGEEMSFSNRFMIGGRKTITGLFLEDFLTRITAEEKEHYLKYVVDDISDGGKIFGSNIVKSYPLEEFEAAMEEQSKVASQGKIILIS